MRALLLKAHLVGIALLGLWPLRGRGQVPFNLQRDSLRALLRTQPADTGRVLLLIQLGQQYETSQPDSAKRLYQRAGRLSEQLHYPRGVVKYIANYTSILNVEGRFAESARLNRDAIALSQRFHFRRYLAVSLGNLANVYLRQENYPLAIATELKALPILESLQERSSLSLLYNSLSVCYDNLHQHAQALRCGQQALALGEAAHDDYLIMLASLALGNTYKALDRLGAATAAYRRSLALARQLRAVEAQKSIALNLGDLYVQQDEPGKALPLFHQAGQLADSIHDVEGKADAWKGLARGYYQQRQFGAAQQYARQGLALARRHGLKKVQRDCYDALADVAVAQGQLAAGRQLRGRADALADTLLGAAVQKSAQEVEARYRVQQQRTALAQQRRELAQQHRQVAQQRGWLLAAGAGVALLGLLLFILYRYYRQRHKLDAQRLQTLRAEGEAQRLKAQLDGQAQERQRISQEMHDDLGAGLTSIMYLSHALQGPPAQAGAAAARIGLAAGQLVGKMNEVIWTLNDAHDTLESLVLYLRTHTAELLDDAGLDYGFDIEEPVPAVRVSKEVRRNVYLVVREAVHNAIKHAACRRVAIGIHFRGGLHVCVQDDGRGLPDAASRLRPVAPGGQPLGNGLANMRQRMARLAGRLSLETAPGGTRVRLWAPLPA